MYLVSEQYHKNTYGGYGICNIFTQEGDNIIDCTDSVALLLGLTYDRGSIRVNYGHGTGFSRIKNGLLGLNPDEKVFDVSVFNYI